MVAAHSQSINSLSIKLVHSPSELYEENFFLGYDIQNLSSLKNNLTLNTSDQKSTVLFVI
jgi:hypothetical protein